MYVFAYLFNPLNTFVGGWDSAPHACVTFVATCGSAEIGFSLSVCGSVRILDWVGGWVGVCLFVGGVLLGWRHGGQM